MRLFVGILLLTLTLFFGGCSQANIREQTAGLTSGQDILMQAGPAGRSDTTQRTEGMLTIGSPGAAMTEVVLTNQTGQEVSGLQIKGVDTSVYSVQLFEAGERWAQAQSMVLYLDLSKIDGAEEGGQQGRAETEVLLRPQYDLSLTMSDGSTCELHALSLVSLVDARVRSEDGIVYLVYREGDTEASTLESERARR